MINMPEFVVFDSDNGHYGIEDSNGAIAYEAIFDCRQEAEAIANAHNHGAFSYEDALTMIEATRIGKGQ